MPVVPSLTTFVREFEIECTDEVLCIQQCEVGDVGCVVWDSAIVLAKYLDFRNKNNAFLHNKSVIELGAGTGIVGLVAGCLGANVVLTDLPTVIPLLEQNINSNHSVLVGPVQAQILKWGDPVSNFVKPDFILVSDCVYYNEGVEPLVNTICDLSGPHTEVLVSFEDREIGNKRELQQRFLEFIKKEFQVQKVSKSELHPEYSSSDIHVLKVTKK